MTRVRPLMSVTPMMMWGIAMDKVCRR
uniref:Uncharacterized protein n=1 Tax=Rhizophora mucronata TaxID=61149 RepID=A0A2P2N3V0_RHIMU